MTAPIAPREMSPQEHGELVAWCRNTGNGNLRTALGHIEWLRRQEVSLHADLVTERAAHAETRSERDLAIRAANHSLSCTAKAVAELEEAMGLLRELDAHIVDECGGYCFDRGLELRERALALLAGARAKTSEAKPAADPYQHKTDDAYEQRNRLVAALARLVIANGGRAGLRKTDIPGWDAEWHNCCWIDLPTGQASWHFRDSELHLFDGLPRYPDAWDGHGTETKHERLNAAWTAPPVVKQAEGRPSDDDVNCAIDWLAKDDLTDDVEVVRSLLAYTKRLESYKAVAIPGLAAENAALRERAEAAEKREAELEDNLRAIGEELDAHPDDDLVIAIRDTVNALGSEAEQHKATSARRKQAEERVTEIEPKFRHTLEVNGDLVQRIAQLEAERDGGGERRVRFEAEWHDIDSGAWHPIVGHNRQRLTAKAAEMDVANAVANDGFRYPYRIVKVTELREVLSAAAVEVGDV